MENKKLQQLYNALKPLEDKAYTQDLCINGPNEDDEHDYICFDQKIIHCIDDSFDISCLYDSHPTMKFDTILEVVEFYHGTWEATKIYKDTHETLTSLDIAYNCGVYCELASITNLLYQNCAKHRLNPIQYKMS